MNKKINTVPRMTPAKTALYGPEVVGFTIAEWCPTEDGSGKPEAVAIVFNLHEVGDVILRLRSQRVVDETIAALATHAASVFGPEAATWRKVERVG